MSEARPEHYTATQIMLHWSVATLVAFQFFVNDEISDAWRAFVRGEAAAAEQLGAANIHVVIGLAVLVLALWRIWLRLTVGAPPPPENEPRALRIVAASAHGLIYVLIVVTPLSGAAAWFLGAQPAAAVHGAARALLFVLIVLHVAGALAQLLVFRSNVFWRMLVTKD